MKHLISLTLLLLLFSCEDDHTSQCIHYFSYHPGVSNVTSVDYTETEMTVRNLPMNMYEYKVQMRIFKITTSYFMLQVKMENNLELVATYTDDFQPHRILCY